MEECILNYFICDDEIISTCDFKPHIFENKNYIYEVVRVINGTPLFFAEHMQRFFGSAILNKINNLPSELQIRTKIKALIETNKLKDGNIKFTLLNNKQQKTEFYSWISPSFYPTNDICENGVDCSLINETRINPNSKSVNFSLIEKVRRIKSDKKVFEVLLAKNKLITEGSRSNVFFVKNNVLYTAPAKDVLEGISRDKVIHICNTNNIKLIIKKTNTSDLQHFDAAFLTGTSIKVLPIFRIDNLEFNCKNQVVNKLINGFEKLILTDMMAFKWNL